MRDDDVYRAIKALILKFLPELTPDRVVRGWNNRVPPPPGGFALMRILYHSRQATNLAEYDPPGESVTLAQSALVVVQVDFYGARPVSMADGWAHDFATVWRDAVACDFLAGAASPRPWPPIRATCRWWAATSSTLTAGALSLQPPFLTRSSWRRHFLTMLTLPFIRWSDRHEHRRIAACKHNRPAP